MGTRSDREGGADRAPGGDARTLAAELERYWVEQARRAKEICDLLERHLRGGIGIGPQLRVLPASSPPVEADPDTGSERRRPALTLVPLDQSQRG